MFDGCEYAHFIECVFLFSVGQVTYFDFFQGILQTILRPFYLVNAGIGAVTYKYKEGLRIYRVFEESKSHSETFCC
jgi:hypothetical protein